MYYFLRGYVEEISKNKKWIGYCRVSTKEQARDGYSLKYQEIKLEEYFILNKIENYQIITDDGYTGTNEKRPGIKYIKEQIQKNKIAGIVVIKTDRLHRDIVDQSRFYNKCRENNTMVVSLTENINFETAMGRAMLNITTTYSQMESETIAERTKQGLIAKAKLGEYPFRGCPYGFEKQDDKTLKAIIPEKNIVKFIFSHYYLKPGELKRLINIKFNKTLDYNQIKAIKKHLEFYNTGMVSITGTKIKIVDPIINEIVLKDPVKKVKSVRNTQDYRYYNKVYFNGIRMQHKSAYGKSGKKYLYYVSRETGLSISEKEIDKQLGLSRQIPYEEIVRRITDISVNFVYNNRNVANYINQIKDCREIYIPGNIKRINVIDKNTFEVEYYETENIRNEIKA